MCAIAARDFNEGELVIEQNMHTNFLENTEKLKAKAKDDCKLFAKSLTFQFSENFAITSNMSFEDWKPIMHSCDPNL